MEQNCALHGGNALSNEISLALVLRELLSFSKPESIQGLKLGRNSFLGQLAQNGKSLKFEYKRTSGKSPFHYMNNNKTNFDDLPFLSQLT